MRHTRALAGLAMTTALTMAAGAASAVDITLMRFFGDCQNDYGSVNDAAQANGECGIITALTNQFNATNTIGAKVVTQTADWGAYYDLLTATFQTGNIPDVAVMHASVLPNFTSRNLLTPLSDLLAEAGVDESDIVPAALANASVDGQMYAMPFDLHAILFHINMDLMAQAGLVNEDGSPKLPTSAEEFISMGKQFEEATGKNFFATESGAAEGMTTRLFDSLMWQQGVDVISADGTTATINSPEGLAAATFIKSIYDEGLADPSLDYAGAEQAFLNGDAGILLNGTWVVDSYNAQAEGGEAGLKTYRVADVPRLMGDTDAVWADSHMWVMPVDESRTPEEQEAAVAFLKFLYDNDFQWSRTGHLAVRQSVIDSPDFAALPHRSEFAGTAAIARSVPQTPNQRAVYNAMFTDLNGMWLSGTDPQAAVDAMQASVERILRRNR